MVEILAILIVANILSVALILCTLILLALKISRKEYQEDEEDDQSEHNEGQSTSVIYKWKIDPDGYYPYCPICLEEMTDNCPNCGVKLSRPGNNK